MRFFPWLSLLALSACSPDDPTGTWVGETTTEVLGQRTDYGVVIDLVADDNKNITGIGVLSIAGLDQDVEVEGDQKRRKLDLELIYLEGDVLDSFLDVKIKGKIKDDEIDAKFSVGKSVVKTSADMILTRQ